MPHLIVEVITIWDIKVWKLKTLIKGLPFIKGEHIGLIFKCLFKVDFQFSQENKESLVAYICGE